MFAHGLGLRSLALCWCFHPGRNSLPEAREMFGVPGVNGLGLRLDGALSDQRIIDGSTGHTASRSPVQHGNILLFGERDQREALTDVVQEEHRLIGIDAVFAGHPGQDRIEFCQAVRRGATALLFLIEK